MEAQPIDLVQLVTTVMALLLALIPILGLVVRFAARPVVEALVASRGDAARPADLEALKIRVEALEHEVKDLAARPAAPRLPEPLPLRP